MENYHTTASQGQQPLAQTEQTYWSRWTQTLQQWGLEHVAAALLEGAGPLNLLLAQGVYLGSPFFQRSGDSAQIQALAQLLEDPQKTRRFAAFLRKEEIA